MAIDVRASLDTLYNYQLRTPVSLARRLIDVRGSAPVTSCDVIGVKFQLSNVGARNWPQLEGREQPDQQKLLFDGGAKAKNV